MSTVFLDISSVPLCTSILNAHFDSLLVAWHLKKKKKKKKTFFFVGDGVSARNNHCPPTNQS